MTRCGTLSQNGYGTSRGAIQKRSFLRTPTQQKNKWPSAQPKAGTRRMPKATSSQVPRPPIYKRTGSPILWSSQDLYKKALRVALTRCGTLSQNGYGTSKGAIRKRSFLSTPTKRKNKRRPAEAGRQAGAQLECFCSAGRLHIVCTWQHGSAALTHRLPERESQDTHIPCRPKGRATWIRE